MGKVHVHDRLEFQYYLQCFFYRWPWDTHVDVYLALCCCCDFKNVLNTSKIINLRSARVLRGSSRNGHCKNSGGSHRESRQRSLAPPIPAVWSAQMMFSFRIVLKYLESVSHRCSIIWAENEDKSCKVTAQYCGLSDWEIYLEAVSEEYTFEGITNKCTYLQ